MFEKRLFLFFYYELLSFFSTTLRIAEKKKFSKKLALQEYTLLYIMRKVSFQDFFCKISFIPFNQTSGAFHTPWRTRKQSLFSKKILTLLSFLLFAATFSQQCKAATVNRSHFSKQQIKKGVPEERRFKLSFQYIEKFKQEAIKYFTGLKQKAGFLFYSRIKPKFYTIHSMNLYISQLFSYKDKLLQARNGRTRSHRSRSRTRRQSRRRR